MQPFVLLYGISAVYFNHPGLISTSTTREFDTSALSDSQTTPEPQLLAKQILAAINGEQNAQEPDASASGDRRPSLELADEPNPRFSGSMSYNYRSEDEQFTVSVDPASQSARLRRSELRSTNNEPTEPNPFARLPEQPELASIGEQARKAALAVLTESGIETDSLDPTELIPSRRGGTRFQFDAQSAGETYRVSYDLATGHGTATPLGEVPEIEPERFLMRLHVSHGYPNEMNVRWWWAFIVDAMFVNMLMWGLSGALMWWQLKKTRKLGTAFLVASAVVTCWLFVGMHDEFVANARARSIQTPQVVPSASTRTSEGRRSSTSSGEGNKPEQRSAQQASTEQD